MPKTRQCIYCRKQVVNCTYHQECRNAHCEGILGELQNIITKKGGIGGLPSSLVEKILNDKFTNPEELQAEKEKTETLKKAREDWERKLHSHLLKATEEFKKESPEPDSATY